MKSSLLFIQSNAWTTAWTQSRQCQKQWCHIVQEKEQPIKNLENMTVVARHTCTAAHMYGTHVKNMLICTVYIYFHVFSCSVKDIYHERAWLTSSVFSVQVKSLFIPHSDVICTYGCIIALFIILWPNLLQTSGILPSINQLQWTKFILIDSQGNSWD